MALFFAFESLKFYKMRNQRFVALFFVSVMLLVFGALSIEVGDKNFQPLFQAIEELVRGGRETLPDSIPLTKGNWIYLGYLLLVILALELLKYLFSASFVAESMGNEPMDGFKRMLRYLPSTIVLLLLSALIMGLSSFVMLIPYFWFVYATFFGPLLRAETGDKFWSSLESSYRYTKGNKFMLFVTFMILQLFLGLIDRLVRFFTPYNLLGIRLTSAFFLTLTMMVQGRFMGLSYLYFVKVFPRMANAFGYRDPRQMMKDIENQKPPHMRPSNRDGKPHYPYPHDPYAGDELSDGESSEVDEDQDDNNDPYDSDDRKK